MKNLLNQLGSNLGNLGGGLGEKITGTLAQFGQSQPAQSAQATANNNGGGLGSLGGLGGMLGSAALGGLVGTLLSGKTAKKVAEGALVVGGTAAVGALAWKFYQKWSTNTPANAGTPSPQPTPQAEASPSGWPSALTTPQGTSAPVNQQEATALLLLEAMVFAARADGHIDAQEQANIHNAVESLFPNQNMAAVVDGFLSKPLDPESLAARVNNHEEACDLYRISCMIINVDHFMERGYLDGLARALKLSSEEVLRLDQEVVQAKQQMLQQ